MKEIQEAKCYCVDTYVYCCPSDIWMKIQEVKCYAGTALNDKTRVGMCVVDDWTAGTVSSTNGDSLSLLQEASSTPPPALSQPAQWWMWICIGGSWLQKKVAQANIRVSGCAPTPVLRRPCHGGRVHTGPFFYSPLNKSKFSHL